MTLSRSNGQSILLRMGESVKFGMGGKFFLRKRRLLPETFRLHFCNTIQEQVETFHVKWVLEDEEPNFIDLFAPVTSLKIRPFLP